MSVNLRNIDILHNHLADYCCIITGISKSEVINLINLMHNDILGEKAKHCNTKKFIFTYKIKSRNLTFGDTQIEKHNFTAIKVLFY